MHPNALFIFVCLVAALATSFAQADGRFEGRLVTEALADGRNLRVIEPFMFVDKQGENWPVPPGTETDGASVPRIFWSLFPPFTGKHRAAAVVHDHYCQIRSKPWRAVHRVFYESMLVAGVDEYSANIMYSAVYAFGPRWSMVGPSRSISMSELAIEEQSKAISALKIWIKTKNPSREQIEERITETRMRDLGSTLFH